MIACFEPARHHRRSIRLRGYDYSQAGAYFVTIVTQERACLFGEIANGDMRLNDAGRMIQSVWDDIPANYPGVETDAFVVMPNHVHAIIVLVGATPCGRPHDGSDAVAGGRPDSVAGGRPQAVADGRPQAVADGRPQAVAGGRPDAVAGGRPGAVAGGRPDAVAGPGQPPGVAPTLSLPDVVHRFKTMTTKRYADGVNQSGWPPFSGRLWQRNYYEHIVRDEPALNRIRQYIIDNPARWTEDSEHPARQSLRAGEAC